MPLLTAAEEIDLAMKIEAGVAATEELERAEDEGKELERRENAAFCASSRWASTPSSNSSRRTCASSWSIAKRYVGRGMLFLDLHSGRQPRPHPRGGEVRLHEGLQVLHVCHVVDPSGHHARHRRPGPHIRIPVHMVETINKLVRIQRQLLQELGREPTPEEIGKEMGLPAERVREIQKISQEPVSLETPIGEEEDSQLGDFIEDDAAVVPPDAASFSMLQEQLGKVLDGLAERERKVISLRFGLEDGHPRTLEEVGREFGVTRERIRQIESKTLAKLRHPSRSSKLKDYLED